MHIKDKITTRIFFNDPYRIYSALSDLYDNPPADITDCIGSLITEIAGLEELALIIDKPYVELEGEICGAIPGDDSFGGGAGYRDILTTGDYIVSNADELISAVGKAVAGQVIFVKGGAEIDLTDDQYTDDLILNFAAGVTLASDRGLNGSTGALLITRKWDRKPLIEVEGDSVRITGICIKGPDPTDHDRMHTSCYSHDWKSFNHDRYYKVPMANGISVAGNNITIDNCELAGFSYAAITLNRGENHYIHHNYIHHNIIKGLGYGIAHGRATSLIEYNIFNYNRHSIAASGHPGSGYEARHNIELGNAIGHNFDAHGGADRKDGTNIACRYVLMHHNIFMEKNYYPYWLRGAPEDRQEFNNNFVYKPYSAFETKHLVGERAYVRNNAFDFNNPVLVRE